MSGMFCTFVLQFDNFRGRFEQYDERMQSESSRRRRNDQNIGSSKCQFRMSKILFIVLRQIEIRRFMKNQPKLRLEPSIYEILSRNSILITWRPENEQISEIFKITKIKIYQNFIHGVTSNRNSEIYENFTQIELRSIYKYESWSRNSILMIPRLSNQQISRIFKITKNQIYQNFTHGVTANRNSRI